MLRSLKALYGYRLTAQDGNVGNVDDFFLDTEQWAVRYLVADTGSWLSERLVLIAPESLGEPEWENKSVSVSLTQAQIERSPELHKQQRISRQQMVDMHQHYGWAWGGSAGVPIVPQVVLAEAEAPAETPPGDDERRMRTAKELLDYHIHATDGTIGHVSDFILDDVEWVIRQMVVNTGEWLSGREVLITPQLIIRTDWAKSEVYVNLTRDKIKDSPPYNPSDAVNRRYEERLYDYYGLPKYWTN